MSTITWSSDAVTRLRACGHEVSRLRQALKLITYQGRLGGGDDQDEGFVRVAIAEKALNDPKWWPTSKGAGGYHEPEDGK